MNYNLYNTQINEIEGEMASLKITLKNTSDKTYAKELEEEIKQLEEQLENFKKNVKKNFKNSNDEFRSRYQINNNGMDLLNENRTTDNYLGSTENNRYQEHEDIE